MKRLSISLPALALAMALFVCVRAESPANTTTAKHKFDLSYYWYIAGYDYFDQYATVADEEYEWWVYLGGIVINTNPSGGILIAAGYQTLQSPFPSVYLYAHLPL